MKKRKFCKLLSLVLTFSFFVNIIGVEAGSGLNNEIDSIESTADFATADDIFVSGTSLRFEEIPEVIDLDVIRNSDSNHTARLFEQETDLNTVLFENDDNTNTMYYFMEPVKFIAQDGSVKDKSNRLYSEFKTDFCSDKYAYVNLENDIRTYFPRVLDGETGVMLTADDVKIELLPISENAAKVINRADRYRSNDENWVYYDGIFGKSTAIRYAPVFNGFKEDVVLYENVGNEFKFLLKPNGLIAELVESHIELYDPETKEVIAEISPIFVYDSADNFTLDNKMMLTPLENGDYEILIIVDKEFLSNSETVYPVYVDPTITINVSTTNVVKSIQDLPIRRNSSGTIQTLLSTTTAMSGTVSSTLVDRWLMRFPGLMNHPTIIATPANGIISANLHLWDTGVNSATIIVNQYSGDRNWAENTTNSNIITWNGAGTQIDRKIIDSVSGWSHFNITTAVRNWKSNTTARDQGLILRNEVENNQSRLKTFFTTRHSTVANRPFVVVTVGGGKTDGQRGQFINNIPNNIGNTFGSDPGTTRIITWQTTTNVPASEVIITSTGSNQLYTATRTTFDNRAYHRAVITGLSHNTTYTFVCGNATNGYSRAFTFTTAPNTMPSNGFTIIHVTDPQIGTSGAATANLQIDANAWGRTIRAATIQNQNAAFIVNTGDVIDDGANNDTTLNRLNRLNFYFDYAQNTVPNDIKASNAFVYSLGNNDITTRSPRDTLTWYNKHVAVPGEVSNNSTPHNYSFVYGNTLFVNVHYEENHRMAADLNWLATQLQRKNGTSIRWLVVMLHDSPFGVDNPQNQRETDLANLFDRYNVDLVLAGQNHRYIRTHPIRANGLPALNSNKQPITAGKWGTVYSIPNTTGTKYNGDLSQISWRVKGERVQTPMFSTIRFTGNNIFIEYFREIDGEFKSYDSYTFR
jgi:hypothetical protein